jgi:hypothetical protein
MQAKQALPVSLTLVRKWSLVSPVSDAFTVLVCFTGVIDTAEEVLSGVNSTGKTNLTVVNDTAKF